MLGAAALVIVLGVWLTPAEGRAVIGLYGNVDVPGNGQTVSQTPYVAGWTQVCRTAGDYGSQEAERVDVVAHQQDAEPVVLDATLYRWLPRWDVYQYFLPQCANASTIAGWHIQSHTGLAPGEWTLHIVMQGGGQTLVQTRKVTVQ
jgi:hypothetical protein